MKTHKQSCRNGCIRRLDAKQVGEGNFSYYKGTLDCPAQINVDYSYNADEVEAFDACGCCSFDDGSKVKSVVHCRFREGTHGWAQCTCHNTPIIYATCLSKRNHGCCPYGLKGDEDAVSV